MVPPLPQVKASGWLVGVACDADETAGEACGSRMRPKGCKGANLVGCLG